MSLSSLLNSARHLLLIDGASGLVMGLELIVFGDFLARHTGLPTGFLFSAGALLLPIALYMIWAGLGRPVARIHLGIIIAGNGLWVLASLGLPVFLALTPLGVALVLGQAAFVALMAALELRVLRDLPAARSGMAMVAKP